MTAILARTARGLPDRSRRLGRAIGPGVDKALDPAAPAGRGTVPGARRRVGWNRGVDPCEEAG
jgi:hypothetical protein